MEHKPIYVDGVDVSKCRYSYREFLTNKVKCSLDGFFHCESLSLCEGKNCCFKQLARTEQKYNLLIRTNKQHVNLLDQLNNKYINLEQECEQKEKELNRYRKALEDIEEATKKISNYLNIGCDITKCEDCNHFESFCTNQCVCYLIEQGDSILDIINKSKGE